MIAFAKRNLKLFFRDKSTVFFSLLTSLIIVGLYVLFLGDVWTDSFQELSGAREIMDNWVMAGLLAVTSVTSGMGAFGIMIGDRSRKIIKDFYSSPIRRSSLGGGYVIGAFVVGYILSLFTLILAQLYITFEGGALMSGQTLLKVLTLLLLADLNNTAMVFFITTLITSENAFSTVSTIIGTLIGFLTGIYLPIGSLPEAVQWVIRLFPPSHAASLLRQAMMEEPLHQVLQQVPETYGNEMKEVLGVTFSFNGTLMPAWGSILILLGTSVLFFSLAVVNLSRRKKC